MENSDYTLLDRHKLLELVISDKKASRTRIAAMYWILERYNARTGYAWPGYGYIAKTSNMSRDSAMDAVGWLEENSYLTIERGDGGRSNNRYFPNFTLVLSGSGDGSTSGGLATSGELSTAAVENSPLGSGVGSTAAVENSPPYSPYISPEDTGYKAGLPKGKEEVPKGKVAADAVALGGASATATKEKEATEAPPPGGGKASSASKKKKLTDADMQAVVDAYGARAEVGAEDFLRKAVEKKVREGWSVAEIVDGIRNTKTLEDNRAAQVVGKLSRSTPVEAPQKATDAPTQPSGPEYVFVWVRGQWVLAEVVERGKKEYTVRDVYGSDRVPVTFPAADVKTDDVPATLPFPVGSVVLSKKYGDKDVVTGYKYNQNYGLMVSLGPVREAPVSNYIPAPPPTVTVGQVVHGGPDNRTGVVEDVEWSFEFDGYIVRFIDDLGADNLEIDTKLTIVAEEAA